ncbi:protein-glutamine gamma-glutamyltransferase 2 [Thalassophryne amazonica]|uniref:protein-glutamine gamma-glutamyltransferase 2 n=1 Tax=Thalassophryne amazonica TaxID=390379 RepID=UPI001471A178|nr:protein-glutamine gamma-glutamyltransferase 2 [Thalassophryne amazonica]
MAQALDIENWNLECEFNNKDHHTDLNGADRLIVRRGQPFTISLYLRSGGYQPGLSCLDCIVETGPQPSEQGGTRAFFGLNASVDVSCWSASVSSAPGNMVALCICSPSDAPIGRYTLTLGQSGRVEFVLLFNPWCPGDAVYMDSQQNLAEYVLAQDGIIFRGSSKYPIPTPWNFGQFESGILDASLRILDMSRKCLRDPGKDCSKRGNPIYVTRVLSEMVNCNDDKGVLMGNWSGNYDGGLSPMFWRGSMEILHSWDRNACVPVRYGQCWVFAAVACSVSRALGIPCRVVTNYNSAHDSNSNLVIEHYIDEDGLSTKDQEMIWNYHCWVESWMSRPDLTCEFNGWQASDPTPQEKSEGVYCCGPVPVRAIKEGELTFKYDAPFVFAEVNADVHSFMKKKNGSTKKVVSTTLVGQKISTKSVGSDARDDITHLYKYPEGSEEERQTYSKANHQNKLVLQKENPGLHLTIKVSSEMKKGCDFDVFAVVTNNTAIEKKCRLVFRSCAISYNGVLGGNCSFKDLLNVELSPGAERRVPLRLNYSKYGDQLTEDDLICLTSLLIDYNTGDAMLALRNIVLENPEIKVRILGEPKVKSKLAAEITVRNPLPEPLQGCCFSIEGANLTGGHVITERLNSTVGPGEDAKVKIYFTPSHSGLRKLLVDFDSDRLCHVKGYRNVIIGK